jgi:hypothetical protein
MTDTDNTQDIVERLADPVLHSRHVPLMAEAAAEITRLRAELDECMVCGPEAESPTHISARISELRARKWKRINKPEQKND